MLQSAPGTFFVYIMIIQLKPAFKTLLAYNKPFEQWSNNVPHKLEDVTSNKH